MTVACVLRSGGDFTADWVWALRVGLRQHLDDFRMVCLSDVTDAPCRVPLIHEWPGWWSKLELFRPGLFSGPVLYLDLDTLVVGDLSDIAGYRGDFAMLADLFAARRGRKRGESGVMAWAPGPHTEALYERFAADPAGAMQTKQDGRWIRRHIEHEYLQDLYPGQIVSFKAHARQAVPDGARLICGHGRPRFTDPAAGWAHNMWRERAGVDQGAAA